MCIAIDINATIPNLDVNRQFGIGCLKSLDRIDPREHRAFVVRRASAVQLAVLLDQLERLRRPSVRLLRRLHIQMTVNAQRLFAMIGAKNPEQDGRQVEASAVGQSLMADVAQLAGRAQSFQEL